MSPYSSSSLLYRVDRDSRGVFQRAINIATPAIYKIREVEINEDFIRLRRAVSAPLASGTDANSNKGHVGLSTSDQNDFNSGAGSVVSVVPVVSLLQAMNKSSSLWEMGFSGLIW